MSKQPQKPATPAPRPVAPQNLPSTTGNKSGGGRSNFPPRPSKG